MDEKIPSKDMSQAQPGRSTGMGSKQVILTSLATLFTQGANSLFLIVLIPVLFAGLGEKLFGIYQLTQRLAQFGGLTNLGASSYLKIRLSELPPGDHDEEKRTALGECLLQWAVLLPVLIVWIYVVLRAIEAKSILSPIEVAAVVTLIAVTPLNQIFAVGQVALFAQGLGYYGIPLASALGLSATAGAALAAHFGYGLAGVAVSLFVGMVLRSVATLAVANRMLPWFGISWPTLPQFKEGITKSFGASVASLSYLGIQQLESLSFGFALGPSMLARLVLTCVGIQFLDIFVRSFIGTAAYGVAPLIRDGETVQLQRLRNETSLNIIGIYSLAAPAIIGLTPLLIRYWVPSGSTLSSSVAAAILVTSLFRLLSQFDGTLLDQARDFHWKTLYSAGIVFLPAAILVGIMTINGPFQYWFAVIPIIMGIYYIMVAHRVKRCLDLNTMLLPVALPIAAALASVGLREMLNIEQASKVLSIISFGGMTFAVGLVVIAVPALRRAVAKTMARFSHTADKVLFRPRRSS